MKACGSAYLETGLDHIQRVDDAGADDAGDAADAQLFPEFDLGSRAAGGRAYFSIGNDFGHSVCLQGVHDWQWGMGESKEIM